MEQALNMLKLKKENLEQQYIEPETNIVEELEENVIIEKHDLTEKKYNWFDLNDDEGATCLVEELSELEITDLEESPVSPEKHDKKFGFDVNVNILEDLDVRDSPPDIDHDNLTEIDRENQSRYFYFYQGNIL